MAQLTVNGEKRELPDGLTVAWLLDHLHVVPERVVVEVNLDILKRHQYGSTALKNGDHVEIVQLVAGGSSNRSRLEAGGCRQLPRALSLQPRAME